MTNIAADRLPPNTLRIRQAPWILASAVFWAWGYLNFTSGLLAERNSLFSHHPRVETGWSLGWPASFFTIDMGFYPTGFVVDLIGGVAFVGGTAFSLRRWKLGESLRIVLNAKTLLAIGLTTLSWGFIAQSTNPLLMLSWFSLFILFGSMPCVAYALVTLVAERRIPQYDLRTMFFVMTVICIAAAVGSAMRSPHMSALVILLFCVLYGVWNGLRASKTRPS